jgi:acyl carrier protein
MTRDDTITRIIVLASRLAGPERTPRGAGPETPLAEGGFWLDSVGLLEMVVACEEEFGVEFDSEQDLTAEALGTVGDLATVIERKLA